MEELFAALEQAVSDYRQAIEECERKRRPMDGLFGLGYRIQDDPCHDRLDQQVKQAVDAICAAGPAPADAERAVRLLLRDDAQTWPEAARLMLRAIQRHSLPLIPLLPPAAAAALLREYAARYKRWDRLPVQQQVYLALKARA